MSNELINTDKDLNYWKNNAEEDYMKVPISVLRYISELEKATAQLEADKAELVEALKEADTHIDGRAFPRQKNHNNALIQKHAAK